MQNVLTGFEEGYVIQELCHLIRVNCNSETRNSCLRPPCRRPPCRRPPCRRPPCRRPRSPSGRRSWGIDDRYWDLVFLTAPYCLGLTRLCVKESESAVRS